MDLDLFTTPELQNLHEQVYRWGSRLFDAEMSILNEMRATPYPSPAYAALDARHAVAAAAAIEQHQLLKDIGRELNTRREAANAR